MKKNNIIAIGMRVDEKNYNITGQAVMFDAFVDSLVQHDYNVKVVALNSKLSRNVIVGRVSIVRIIEYLGILLKALFHILKNWGGILYINSVPTRAGYLRDALFIRFSKFFGYKVFMQQFGSNFTDFYASLPDKSKLNLKKVYEMADVFVVEGDYSRKQFDFLKNYDRVFSVTNGLPEKNLKITKSGKTYKEGTAFNLIFLNNLIESKGYLDVLKAMNILVNDFKYNVKCTIAGKFMSVIDDVNFKSTDEAMKYFKQYIIDHNLNDHVLYFEGLYGNQKADAFSKAHVFLLPSYYIYEGQPIAILEALAYGTVPIVTRYRMIPNMVTDNCGVFVEKQSPYQIALSVKKLMDQPILYSELSQNCVNRYFENFTLEKYSDNILKLISLI